MASKNATLGIQNQTNITFHLDKKMIQEINDDMLEKIYGWYLDSNGKSKYFLSIFNQNNYSEELIFEIDFTKDDEKDFVVEGLRFTSEKGILNIDKRNKYYQEAGKVAKYIKKEYLV